MSDLATTLQRIAAAPDLQSLDAERVSALGKSGWVTVLLKTLGQMSPEERQSQGPAIQGQRADVAAAIDARKAALEAAELGAQARRPSGSTSRFPPPSSRRAASIR